MLGHTGTDRWRAWRADPLLVAGVLLILLQTCVRAVVVMRSYFWQDDLFHLTLLQRTGLSGDFLVREHNGHLEIGPNLVYGLIGRDPGPSFLPAALWLLALQLVASCLLLAVLRQLFGRSPWILVPFAVYLFSPLGLTVATWLAAGLEALPLQIAMLTALLGGVRAYRDRSWAWAAVSAAGTALGLLFWEKAVLVPALLVAVLVLVEEAGTPWRRSLRRVLDSWPYLLPHAVLVAAYVPFYLSVVGRSTLDPELGRVLPTTAETVFAMLVPGLFGGPWTSAGAEDTLAAEPALPLAVLFAALALAVIAVSIRQRGLPAVKAWLLVLGYLAVVVALVQLTRAANLDIAARDPRYVTDALPVIAIGCCAAFSGPRRESSVARRSMAPAAAVGALLVSSSLVTTSLVVGELRHDRSRQYLTDVLQTMDANPGMSVVSALPAVHVSIFDDFDLDETLRALGEERRFDQPATAMGMFDKDAVLRPITLLEPIFEAVGPVADCGWPLPAGEQELGDVPIWYGVQVLRLSYDSPAPVTLHLAVGEDRQDLTVPAGAGQAMFVVTGQQGPVTVRASGAPAGEVCVDDVAVGTPWPDGLSGTS
ncbi:hypothetical protein [Blastococcus sp. SYSU D01042]